MMKKILIVTLMALTLTGCGLMTPAGVADYYAKPFRDDNGNLVCCEVMVNNTKDIDAISLKMERRPDGTFILELDETGVSATDPAKVNAENTTKILELAKTLVPPS